jgi:hypothetical protein
MGVPFTIWNQSLAKEPLQYLTKTHISNESVLNLMKANFGYLYLLNIHISKWASRKPHKCTRKLMSQHYTLWKQTLANELAFYYLKAHHS